MLTKDDYIDLFLPERPRSVNVPHLGGMKRLPKKEALTTRRFVEASGSFTYKNQLTIDLDHEQASWKVKELVWEDGILPEPNVVSINPASGHAHVSYFLDAPVGTRRGLDFLEDITRTLTFRAGGDRAFAGVFVRSAASPYAIPEWGTDHQYTLAELNSFIPEGKRVPRPKETQLGVGDGRNSNTFNAVREWAYKNRYKFTNETEWYAAVEYEVEMYLFIDYGDNMLPMNEIRSISKSIANYTWKNKRFNAEGFSKVQQRRSAKASQKRSNKALEVYEDIMTMAGAGFTNAEMAENLSVTVDALKARKKRMRKAGYCI